jgi:hypothetical protein
VSEETGGPISSSSANTHQKSNHQKGEKTRGQHTEKTLAAPERKITHGTQKKEKLPPIKEKLPSQKLEVYTEEWETTMRRFQHLRKYPPEQVIEYMEQQRLGVPWTFGTTETYLTAAAVENHPAIRRYKKFLKKNVKVETKARTRPFRKRHLRRLLRSQTRRTRNIDLAIEIAFTFGQRVSDILQLHHDDVSYVRIVGKKFLVLLVRRGKTITCTGPYTLHLPASHRLALLLHNLKHRRPAFLFSSRSSEITKGTGNLPQLSPAERSRMSARVRCRLRSIKPTLGTRSIRRGGLQRLATEVGLPLPTIQESFSKHTMLQRLGEYLEHFRYSTTQATVHAQACCPILRQAPITETAEEGV